jgi:hypothetical protein
LKGVTVHYAVSGPATELSSLVSSAAEKVATALATVYGDFMGVKLPVSWFNVGIAQGSLPRKRGRSLTRMHNGSGAEDVPITTVGKVLDVDVSFGETPSGDEVAEDKLKQVLEQPSTTAAVAQRLGSAGLLGTLGAAILFSCKPDPVWKPGCQRLGDLFQSPVWLGSCDIDLAILLDNSGSIYDPAYGGNADGFNMEKQLVTSIMTSVADPSARILVYSMQGLSTPSVSNVLSPDKFVSRAASDFDVYYSRVNLYTAPFGNTWLAAGLNTANKALHGLSETSKPGVAPQRAKVILLITDGQDKFYDVMNAAENIKYGTNTHIVTVGMGTQASMNLLGAVADSPQLATMFKSIQEAVSQANDIASKLCGEFVGLPASVVLLSIVRAHALYRLWRTHQTHVTQVDCSAYTNVMCCHAVGRMPDLQGHDLQGQPLQPAGERLLFESSACVRQPVRLCASL